MVGVSAPSPSLGADRCGSPSVGYTALHSTSHVGFKYELTCLTLLVVVRGSPEFSGVLTPHSPLFQTPLRAPGSDFDSCSHRSGTTPPRRDVRVRLRPQGCGPASGWKESAEEESGAGPKDGRSVHPAHLKVGGDHAFVESTSRSPIRVRAEGARRRSLWRARTPDSLGVSAFLCTAAVLSNCLRLHPFLRVLETR